MTLTKFCAALATSRRLRSSSLLMSLISALGPRETPVSHPKIKVPSPGRAEAWAVPVGGCARPNPFPPGLGRQKPSTGSCFSAACTGSPIPSESVASTTSVPADEARANGPLVGDPALVPGEQSCVQAEGNRPWYPTIAAFEVHDSDRTHLYACAHFLGSTSSSDNTVYAYSSQQIYTTPYNIVDRGPNELFVYGGGYGDNPAASGSFVARVQPGTFDQVWRTVLINTNVTGEWNYPGVLNVLADGSLVVIFGYHIAKIDPQTGTVLQETALPTGASTPANTSYNGYDALPDGT